MNEAIGSTRMAMEMVYQALDEAIEVQKARVTEKTLHCHAGCATCCTMVVDCAGLEAQAIADTIQNLPTRRQRAAVLQRLADWCVEWWAFVNAQMPLLQARYGQQEIGDQNRRLTLRWQVLRKACPFLDLTNRTCGIYAMRPLACRTLLVLEPNEEDVTEDGRPGRFPGEGCGTTPEDVEEDQFAALTAVNTDLLRTTAAERLLHVTKVSGITEDAGVLACIVYQLGCQQYGWPHPHLIAKQPAPVLPPQAPA